MSDRLSTPRWSDQGSPFVEAVPELRQWEVAEEFASKLGNPSAKGRRASPESVRC